MLAKWWFSNSIFPSTLFMTFCEFICICVDSWVLSSTDDNLLLLFFFLIFILYWSIVGLQCCVSFRCTAKWFSYTYTYISSFSDSFPVWVITSYSLNFDVQIVPDLAHGSPFRLAPVSFLSTSFLFGFRLTFWKCFFLFNFFFLIQTESHKNYNHPHQFTQSHVINFVILIFC